jgi:hypothetical protein
VVADLELETSPRDHVRVLRLRVVDGQRNAHELLGRLVRELAEVALGDLAHLGPAEALEHRKRAVGAELREAARHDQLRRQIGVARSGRKGDDAAERLSEDHRPFELERLAKLDEIQHPAVEVPLRRIVAVAPPLPAMVEQNELRDVGQRRERVRQPRVVEPRAAV